MTDTSRKKLQTPHVWTFTTYFAEGFPYSIIRTISSVFFRDMKVSLEAIGLTSLFGLPWALKFLWGPQIDQFGTKRRWMLTMQLLLLIILCTVAVVAPLDGGVEIIAVLFLAGAFLAATHDMAIDGYYMEALDKEGQSRFVGYRVMAYQISRMTGTGIIVTVGTMISWQTGFFCAALMLGSLYAYHVFLLPQVETPKKPIRHLYASISNMKFISFAILSGLGIVFFRWLFSLQWWQGFKGHVPFIARITISGWVVIGLLMALVVMALFKNRIKGILYRNKDVFYSRAFISYIDRKRIGIALAFIILMRTGEAMLATMASPFMVDLGIQLHYGWISAGVGLPFSIVGAMLGGWMISRYTLRRTLMPFLLAQNLTNVVYMFLAFGLNRYVALNTGADELVPIGQFNLFLVAVVHAFDQFAGGLGTAVLVTFLMRTCLPEYKAAHFAIGTGLMNIGGVLSGVTSGFLAHWLGYGIFFGISFLVSIPAMGLAFFLPFMESEKEESVVTTS